jgi:hypothetical protein
MSTVKMATLKDGSEVRYDVLATASVSIRTVAGTNIFALCDLIEKCKNDRHQITANEYYGSKSILTKYGLIDANGQVPDDIKKIVSNAFKGSGLAIKFVNPLREKEITTIEKSDPKAKL